MPTMTRGPLPPGVYWRRRAFVLLLGATLVFVFYAVLTGGSDGSDDGPVAQQAGAEVQLTETVTVQPSDRPRRRERTAPPTQEPLAEPEGRCSADDIRVVPSVEEAVVGRDVTVGLALSTIETPACTWQLDAWRLVVRVTDAGEEVWSSRDCPAVLPDRQVVLRQTVATALSITWTPRESDAGCAKDTNWVPAGDYTVAASAIGGEPEEAEFELSRYVDGPGASEGPDAPSDGPERTRERQQQPEESVDVPVR